MSPTALKRAAIALAVLVVVWGTFGLLNRSGGDELGALDLPQLNAADVDAIVIARPADTVRLERQDGAEWTVNGYRARTESVEEWFTALGDAAQSEQVARSAASHERLGVDAAAGQTVRFVRGADALVDIVVGKSGRVANSGYVRLAGEVAVYRVRGAISRLAGRRVDDWRDRRIATVDIDSVARVEVVRYGTSYTLARADSASWTIDGAPADSAAAWRVVGAIRDLQASGFPSPEQLDSVGFDEPYRRLRAVSAGGRTLLALLFDSTSAGTWTREEAGGPVYRLDRWRIDGLTPADSTLRKQ